MSDALDELQVIEGLYTPGWVDDPEEVVGVISQQPFPIFSATPAGEAADEPDQVFGWKLYERVTGSKWPSGAQGSVGSCVSWGTAAAVTLTQCAEIAAGQPESFTPIAQEPIYALSRVEIGKRRIRGDGSVGAWAADAVKTYGVIARGKYGGIDLTEYSAARCKTWGWDGLPDELEPVARRHPVRAFSLVRTAQDARRALANGYGVSVCSNQGFRLVRDEQGYCAARGTWAHCMALIGYQRGTRPGFFIQNSWGSSVYSGPMGAGDGPAGGFWADEHVVERMLAQGDSYAFSDLAGFEARHVDWSTL